MQIYIEFLFAVGILCIAFGIAAYFIDGDKP